MSEPRVSEEIIEAAIRSLDYEHSGDRLTYWENAQKVRVLLRALLAERREMEARLAEMRGVPIRDRDICDACGSGLVEYKKAIEVEINMKLADARREAFRMAEKKIHELWDHCPFLDPFYRADRDKAWVFERFYVWLHEKALAAGESEKGEGKR